MVALRPNSMPFCRLVQQPSMLFIKSDFVIDRGLLAIPTRYISHTGRPQIVGDPKTIIMRK